MRLRELSKLFHMDWVKYFNTYFSKAGFSGDFTEDSVVIVETLKYFRLFDFAVTDNAVNYAKWQLLVKELSFANAVDDFDWDIFRKLRYPKSSKLGASDNLPCVELVEQSMPLAIARPFVEEFVTTNLIDTVNETANQIEKAFVQRLMEKDWLDQPTKDQCAEKVNAITRQIAYPDFIKIDSKLDKFYEKLDISIRSNFFEIGAAIRNFQIQQMVSSYSKPTDKTQWLDAPTEVNAYYSPQFNQFVFLAGILRPPFIAATWPPFLLYGAFGAVIGHELTHGFDDQGQQFDKNGNRVKWWTDNSIRQFQNRTQCFVDQYDQYSLLDVKINGELTLGENIADNGGVHTAYHAYKNVMNGTKAIKYKGLSEDQLFFVSFAQLYCSLFTDAALEQSTKTDPHSPGPIRVLGTLVNSEEFTEAFQCSKGSKMYPSDDRCELW
ncbi:endothelin-converting enzyme homolog isoform X2 [Dysidea avara]